jgi:hypothetical protein
VATTEIGYNPGPNDPPIWGLFDSGGLEVRWLPGDWNGPLSAQNQAFSILNANAGIAEVYIVLLRFSDPQTVSTWYEVGDRVYAPPEGETIDPPSEPPGG